MNSFFKVAVFCLIVIGAFTAFAVWYVPDIPVTQPPAVHEQAISDDAALVAVGEAIFYGKGNCTLCHDKRGNRAPALDGIAFIAPERLKDVRYKGKATTADEYVYESLVNPSAYVVKGYGARGSGDAISPMPEATGPAIGLTDIEANAVASFLLSGGFH
ncbi:hypothetical protein EPN18_09200 [bacterium]|nr:MAG: hypothetical protein EPN18_09200 [bacterium]